MVVPKVFSTSGATPSVEVCERDGAARRCNTWPWMWALYSGDDLEAPQFSEWLTGVRWQVERRF
jgi:hypothetical protein